jgi:F0F1-type ATP synthase membrane subunit c/vacuolar-type H+-ATPase subunit K
MKRIVLFAALLLTLFCATSCGIANGMTQATGRLVQAVGRTVGM